MQGFQLPEVVANLGSSSGFVVSLMAVIFLVITVLVLRHKGDKDVRVKFGPFEIDRRSSPESREPDRRELPPTESQGDDQSSA